MKPINLFYPSKKLFFLIHGYTGSPMDFNGLPSYLQKQYKTNVKVMLLPGHGTKVEDLDNLELCDFIHAAEKELEKNIEKYDEIIIGGISFGAQLAFILASQYPVQGIFNVCLPYRLKFPFNIPGIDFIGHFKKYWLKPIPKEKEILRGRAFHYKAMHANGLKIVKQANCELKKSLPKIKCPVITIHSTNDPIGSYKALNKMEKKIIAPHSKKIFHDKNHNLFFSKMRFNIYKSITDFFRLYQTQDEVKEKIAAIVPAYNESGRIGDVLEVLYKTKVLNEIIVIDDSSTDNTPKEVEKFTHVKLLRNDRNKGKAYSLQRGIDSTNADILFFCDADLQNLTPEIVKQIIEPVAKRQYDMYIGIRNNVMQKAVTLFALNSGERALRRELWDKLPENFKFRYRIEAGLNFIARSQGKGYGWQKFNYYQTLKEKKYGFLKGTILRWWMNLDVGYAYLLSAINHKKHIN